MKGSRAAQIALALLLALAGASNAGAQGHDDARNAAIEANPFHLDPAGQTLLSSGAAQVLGPFEYRAQVVGQYLSQPIVVRAANDAVLRDLVGSRVQLDVSGAIGLFGRVEAALLLPVIVSQSGEPPGRRLGDIGSAGLGDLMLQLKGTILSEYDYPVGLAAVVRLGLPTGDDEAYMGVNGVTVQPQLVASALVQSVRLSLNLGYLAQENNRVFTLADEDKLLYRLGAEVSPEGASWAAALELFGSGSASEFFGDADTTTLEAVAGLRYRIDDTVDVFAGGGRGLLSGVPSPSIRGFLGVAYHHGRRIPGEDPDEDGLLGWDDECRFEPEDVDDFEDGDGCPDVDNDRDQIADSRDECPLDAEDYDGFQDIDGCPDNDNDGDSVVDDGDLCPDEAEDLDGFEDGDGCPDPDNDGDGVPDSSDKCPMNPENMDGFADEDGCPEVLDALAVLTPTGINIREQIHFELGTANLTAEGGQVLDHVIRILRDHPRVHLRIEGHTDNLGGRDFNQSLSQARANAVRTYLIDNSYLAGMSERLEAVGYGEDNPIANNMTERGRSRNRRVEFHLVEVPGVAPK